MGLLLPCVSVCRSVPLRLSAFCNVRTVHRPAVSFPYSECASPIQPKNLCLAPLSLSHALRDIFLSAIPPCQTVLPFIPDPGASFSPGGSAAYSPPPEAAGVIKCGFALPHTVCSPHETDRTTIPCVSALRSAFAYLSPAFLTVEAPRRSHCSRCCCSEPQKCSRCGRCWRSSG